MPKMHFQRFLLLISVVFNHPIFHKFAILVTLSVFFYRSQWNFCTIWISSEIVDACGQNHQNHKENGPGSYHFYTDFSALSFNFLLAPAEYRYTVITGWHVRYQITFGKNILVTYLTISYFEFRLVKLSDSLNSTMNSAYTRRHINNILLKFE